MMGQQWNEECETTLTNIAKLNDYKSVEWLSLKELIKQKITINVSSTVEPTTVFERLEKEKVDVMCKEVEEFLDDFEQAPFTIQRICELLQEPNKHYTSLPKYLRAMLKLVSVTSSEDDVMAAVLSQPDAFKMSGKVPIADPGMDDLGVDAKARWMEAETCK